jgi:hypothetical protein
MPGAACGAAQLIGEIGKSQGGLSYIRDGHPVVSKSVRRVNQSINGFPFLGVALTEWV